MNLVFGGPGGQDFFVGAKGFVTLYERPVYVANFVLPISEVQEALQIEEGSAVVLYSLQSTAQSWKSFVFAIVNTLKVLVACQINRTSRPFDSLKGFIPGMILRVGECRA